MSSSSDLWNLAAFSLRRFAGLNRERRKRLAEAETAARRELRKRVTLRKVAAQVRVGELGASHECSAQVILNDFTHEGLKLYSSEPLGLGQEVAVSLEAPRPLYARARVVFCYEFTQSGRILRGHHFPYRVGVEFVFDSEEERTLLAGYCRELREQHLVRR
jgi:hypothetical protein